MIRLETLGALDLRNAEGSELRAIVAQPKRLALLVYLAASTPRGFHRRDSILSLFWRDRDLEHARASLSRAVYFVRRELGAGVIVNRGTEEIGLDRERIWCDAAAFDDALQAGRYGEALDLYHGELLPGFFLSEAAGFEEWLESQRTRLRNGASTAAWRLADQEEAAGRFPSAAQFARRGVELAPFREDGFRRFLALLDRTGDRAGAAHAYAKFADELARELDVSPSPETQRLIDAIKTRVGAVADSERAEIRVEPGRPSDAAAVGAATHPEPVASPSTVDPRRRWTPRSIVVGAAGASVLAIVSVLLMATKTVTVDPLRLEVAPWTNRTGDRKLDRVGAVAAERLITAIRLAGIVKDSQILGARSNKRAGTLVSGHFDLAGGVIRFHVAVTDVRRGGKPWLLAPIVVPVEFAEQAIDSARPRVLGAVAALQHPYYGPLLPLASPPPTFDAFHEFLEGLALQTDERIIDALDHYRWAAAIDSSFTWALVHGGLVSLGWYRRDLKAQADTFVATLRLAHGRLTPLQSHLLDYMSSARAEDWLGSYRAIREAADIAPHQYGLMFANRANQVNRPREAVDALTRSGMDSIHRRNIGYWRLLSGSLHRIGEHERELAIAQRAREIDKKSVSAIAQEMRALSALGRIRAVSATLDTLTSVPREGWLTFGHAATSIAMDLRAHGHTDAASATMQRAIAAYRSRPAAERKSQEWREWFADALYAAEDFAAADTAFRSLMRQFRTSYGYPDNAYYLGRLGAIAARRGDRATAKDMSNRLIKTDRFQAVPGQESRFYRARIAALLGDHAEAMRLLVSAYGAFGTTELHDDMDFEGMKSYPAYHEFVRPKG